jgi:hypothetical protein
MSVERWLLAAPLSAPREEDVIPLAAGWRLLCVAAEAGRFLEWLTTFASLRFPPV